MRILVVGAGIAGLSAAMALSGEGRTVEVIDRDPPPPAGGMNEVFECWERRGATQLRHSHAFMARMVNMISTRYPELRERLLAAGVREFGFDHLLWPSLRARYKPEPIDDDWRVLTSRRTTLEAVLRKFAEECSGAIFHSGYKVAGIRCDPGASGIPTVKALDVETPDGVKQVWEADLIVDASGRVSPLIDWLEAYGVVPEKEEAPTGILYYTRHYRLNPGKEEPDQSEANGGDYGFVKAMAYPGDNGNFTITIFVPEIEAELRKVMLHPDVFDNFASRMPGLRRWLEPGLAQATSKVYGMGDLKSVWRRWIKNDQPIVLNYFAIGDATSRTNPSYGRGCTIAMLHAHFLAAILAGTTDPVERSRLFEQKKQQEIRPYYDAMARLDEDSMKRAAKAQNPDSKPSLADKIRKSFAQDAVVPAMRSNIKVTRAFSRSAMMLARPRWLNPELLAIILTTWATPKRFKRHLYMPTEGVERAEFVEIAQQRLRATAAAQA